MQPLNRFVVAGATIATLTALTALFGAPAGFEDFRIPIWELLLQLNLCTGFVFIVLGVLQNAEIAVPDFSPALRLLAASFVTYAAACTLALASPAPAHIKLFMFAFSLACLTAGWARFGVSLLRQLDEQQQ